MYIYRQANIIHQMIARARAKYLLVIVENGILHLSIQITFIKIYVGLQKRDKLLFHNDYAT